MLQHCLIKYASLSMQGHLKIESRISIFSHTDCAAKITDLSFLYITEYMILTPLLIKGMPPAGVTSPAERMIVEPVLVDNLKPQHERKPGHAPETEEFEYAPLSIALIAYLNLGLLVVFGYIRDLMRMFGYECTVGAKEWGNEVKL